MTFTEFIRSCHAHDKPRGDFLEDTMVLIRLNRFPDPKSWDALEWFMAGRHACEEAKLQGYRLWREYEKARRTGGTP